MNVPTRNISYCARVLSAILPIALVLLTSYSTCLRAAPPETETSNRPEERGFLFLDNRYIAPPYVIDRKDDTFAINGHELRTADLERSIHYKTLSTSERRERLYGELHCFRMGAVVLFQNRKPLVLNRTDEGRRLIRVLARSSAPHQGDDEIPETLGSDADRVTWAQLVSEFQPTFEFLTRANEHIAEMDEVERSNANIELHNVWAGRIEYPLTVFAMVVVTLAFGHLVSTKPYSVSDTDNATDSPSPQQLVFRSLLLVGILSVIDLIWTVVASDSGSMRELNPFGRQLIDTPLQLVAFKSATISPAIGLMYWLHRIPIAQAASWWSCLVLTLVTARWLTFSSMFL